MTVTVITGTSSGIGLATAIRLAKAGHKVYAGVRNPDGADNLREVIDAGELPISMLEIDMMDESLIIDAVDRVLAAEGQIDVLVNNAGITQGTSVEETQMSVVRRVFETNYFGVFALTHAVIPGMRERKNGTIVNVSSIAGRFVFPTNAAYASSKYALEALSESLALQLKPFNIRVAIIEPGVTATSVFENAAKAMGPPDTASPYFVHTRRMIKLFTKQLGISALTPPDTVAQAIETAITTDTPKLRYVVGADAEMFWAARQRVSDEEYMEAASIEDDEDYYDAMTEMIGVDLWRP
ncbi:MAG: SDR family oxidoreductase [Rhodospirillaceae bacterium]|jgi:NAD(P)-dependent dehydrogenase (short-subunit alcohol dehydrogenase family)|nr:SDR family oxidoreductase [Rhodospirillaceae bacterium]MBT5191670.1 SDR family oxidoreductase [Rhodospirillaceae bacterium]MBT5895020.1 SDR family oxidoreductase [Rhodospirillaceae bacterium]MBT7760885.1 SDR family oxidoreductase [Rhodospirillaceae bacterium]